ncbi:methylation-associated defense system ATP-binding protein MAD8 [Streptomyces sp. H62]
MSTHGSHENSFPVGLREVREDDLTDALEEMLVPRLVALMRQRGAGHCARITDVDVPLAARLAQGIRSALGASAQVHVLGDPAVVPEDLAVTSTKLVELRNPMPTPNGEVLRPPLLAFVPPGTHASAEDSFGVATFEQIDLGDVYADLVERLRGALPTTLRDGVAQVFEVLDEAAARDPKQARADSRDQARFLLSAQHNDYDPEAAGAALFEVGLVPDFTVFADPDTIRGRVTQNVRVAESLADPQRTARQRVLDLGLSQPQFRERLLEAVDKVGLDDPRTLARSIAVDRANWPLAFQHWPLKEPAQVTAVRVTVAELSLPVAGANPADATDPVLGTISGQHYLPVGSRGMNKFSVEFTVSPDPRQVTGLTRFAARLISEDGGATGVTAYSNVTKTAKIFFKASFTKLDKAGLDAGWHYVRVEPVDADGLPLPVERSSGDRQQPQESDRFFVLPGGDIDEVPDQRFRKDIGVAQALVRLRVQAAGDRRDPADVRLRSTVAKATSGSGQYSLLASFGGHGAVEIPLPPVLTDHQRSVLTAPDNMTEARLEISGDQPGDLRSQPLSWPSHIEDELMDRFLQTRRTIFKLVTGDTGSAAPVPTVEGCDPTALRADAGEYAAAYGALIRYQLRLVESADPDQLPQLHAELGGLLRLDTLTVEHSDPLGGRQEALLVPPTHPLRLLWLVTWSELGRRWLGGSESDEPYGSTYDKATLAAIEHTLLEGLSPLGFPLAVPRPDGRLATAAVDLTPYWGVYLPAGTEDPQGILAQLATGLRLPQQWGGASVVSGSSLADRVERYLRLHPYIRTLTINAVGAGRAEHLADMLIELERRATVPNIRYDMRLYAAPGQQEWSGEALAELLRGEWSTVNAAEAFHVPSADGAPAKLAVAVRPLSDLDDPSPEHASHLTLLFDVFGSEQVDAVPGAARSVAPVHGLVQDMAMEYRQEGGDATWRKWPRHGIPLGLPGAEDLSDVLGSLPAAVSAAMATVATGQAGRSLVPRTSLVLTTEERALLNRAHRISDWVITVDRTMGVDYFDRPAGDDRPDYVIDYDADTIGGLGHHLVVSSRSSQELRTLFSPIADGHAIALDERHTGTFFDQLRLLSGRLAFKLASTSATQRTEVLGLALARLYLDYQGVLADQVLVPLDAHQNLYREARRRADAVGETVGMRRTDLALFGFELDHTAPQRRLITCRLVEVKCYNSLDGITAHEMLKATMTEQLRRSEEVLRLHFARDMGSTDRPDRVVKNAEFSTLLRFHLDRAIRYDVMRTPGAAAEARAVLEALDLGYELEFTHTGLLFDLAGNGSGTEVEGGIEFHRIGRDLIRELVDAVPTDPSLGSDTTEDTTTLATMELAVPRLPQAAFRAPNRIRETSSEQHTEGPELTLFDVESAEPERVQEPDQHVETVDEPGPSHSAAHGDDLAAGELSRDTGAGGQASLTGAESALSAGAATAAYAPDVYLGVSEQSPQYGVLGEVVGRRIALDLNGAHTISLFGVQGGGKSYTLGSVVESASLSASPVNQLPSPLATVVFHYSQTLDYAPEFTSMASANDEPDQVRVLQERYGVEPAALEDVVLLVPEAQLADRQAEHPGLEVRPLKFASAELRAEHWRFLMGAVGNQSTYIRQLGRIMRAHRHDLDLDTLRRGIDESTLTDHIKTLAHQRLDLAAEYIDDNVRVKDLVRPGRLLIVDLRDEFIEKDEALGLFVVLMQLFAEAQDADHRFNKLVVFDEAHKYIDSPDLVAGLVDSVRLMRHKGMTVLVASQDPPSVPIALIELSDLMVLHKFTSPAWLKHLQKANASLAELTPAKMASLPPGSAYVWSGKATDRQFTQRAVRIDLRPRLTRHGGATKTAVDGG